MGIWGEKLYDNDISLDVKGQFETLLKEGKTPQNITEQLLKEFQSIIGDPVEEELFWFALADTQWNLGVLLPNIKEQALYWIEKSRKTSNNQAFSAAIKDRQEMFLSDLQAKLLSPQPSPKKFTSKKNIYICEWNLGDIFAYQLESDLAKEKGLYARYFLIQKVDQDVWYPGHIVPIVYVKITQNSKLPSSKEEYDRLDYVQTWFTKYEERFFPIDMNRPHEDIAQKSKINYEVDEYGFLPQYRVKLLNVSKKVIPQNLIYVGNFTNTVSPQKEFIPHSTENIVAVAWNKFNETFETKMIKWYCGHNLREFSIYKQPGGIS